MIWTLISGPALLPFVVFGMRTLYLSFRGRTMGQDEFMAFCGFVLFCLGVSAGAAVTLLLQKLV